MALLSELFVNAIWRGKQFDKGAKGSSKRVKAFERTVKGTQSVLTAFRSTLGAVGVGLSIDFLRTQVQAQAANIRFAETLDLNLSRLEAYQAGAKRFGVSQDTINDAFLELSRRSREAAEGTGSLKDTLDVLNIPVQQFLKMPLADRFELLTRRFSEMDASSRNFFADESFGGAADAISGILPNITQFANEFERAGLGTSRLKLVGKQFLIDVSPELIRSLDRIESIIRFGGGVSQENRRLSGPGQFRRTAAERDVFVSQDNRTIVGPNLPLTQRDVALLRAATGDPDRQILN